MLNKTITLKNYFGVKPFFPYKEFCVKAGYDWMDNKTIFEQKEDLNQQMQGYKNQIIITKFMREIQDCMETISKRNQLNH